MSKKIWYKILEVNGDFENHHTYTMDGDILDYNQGKITDKDILGKFYGEEALSQDGLCGENQWWLHEVCLVSVFGVTEYTEEMRKLYDKLNQKLNGLL
jgi:hypothetical protein|tara:strand:- start:212 stop:505 length:294 start_codon:yes stop_codon:yes gene_type:complete